jgi:acyl-CoA thioesterase-1
MRMLILFGDMLRVARFEIRDLMKRTMAVIVLLAAAMIAAGCGSSPASPSKQPIRRIVVLGDSLAVTPTVDQSFPAVLQARITSERRPWTITNAGVFGDTTADGVRRVDALLAGDVGILVLALGANDGLGGVDTTIVDRNLSTIVEAAQRHNVRTLLCGMETLPTHGLNYAAAFHAVFPRVAERYAIPLVPFLLDGVALNPSLNGPDLVHPNAAGAQKIADNVWPYLAPLLQ